MSEAELHVLRARLNGGIRNKAARGELRRGLPIGFVWGEADGDILIHPDEAVAHAIRTVFARFAELGSARRVCRPMPTSSRTPGRFSSRHIVDWEAKSRPDGSVSWAILKTGSERSRLASLPSS